MAECTCGAATEGKWADVHTGGCPALESDPHDDLMKITEAWISHFERHRVLTTRDVLREHWLTGIRCDEATKTDVATCYCTIWRSDPKPTVAAAVDAWVDHVMSFMDGQSTST